MKISYCSQIKNRFHQFVKTFDHNFNHIQSHNNTEWIIVDCDSNDGIREFMQDFISIDRIYYYTTLDYKSYSIPVAKNFSARLSSGDYIFNLDVDNYIADTTEIIMEKGESVGLYCSTMKKGIYGRLGCSRNIFEKAGGYDESFLPAGKHDTDLRLRCTELLNYYFEDIVCKKSAILNSKEDTIKNMDSKLSWETMNSENECKMNNNLINRNFHPNKKFTSCQLIKNFKDTILLKEDLFYAFAK